MNIQLPAGVRVFERGWLSANNILCTGKGPAALIDTGYATHSQQTVALLQQALGERPLELLLNTHLHSDHCGGNAALQAHYPELRTLIPPGQAEYVRNWDPVALTYTPTGQQCPPFRLDGLLLPGSEIALGDLVWEVHAAPGHDPHSVILFEPSSRTLVSADAMWENGFGVVFPELEGEQAFDEVGATLDLIESLRPRIVIPGHGNVFTHVTESLAAARRRLDGFIASPRKHAGHAAKVLVKFKLLELQQLGMRQLIQWANATPYFAVVHARWFGSAGFEPWVLQLADDLVRSGAAGRDGDILFNR
ncbi:MAG: MBL fold metallo-hydrolase [Burkholderiales bacterium]|nr:MBL fold metallo-hydrolase [Burkholderiales bacterium]